MIGVYVAIVISNKHDLGLETVKSIQFNDLVLCAQEEVERLAGVGFNSCLLNYYRDGKDSMGWHSDNEPLYGSTPTIGEGFPSSSS